jgi:hypothetical protein
LFTFAVPKKWPGLMTHIKEGALVLTDRTTRPDILGFKNRLGFDVFILAIILKSAEFARVLLKFLAFLHPHRPQDADRRPLDARGWPMSGWLARWYGWQANYAPFPKKRTGHPKFG